jgi:hypothetical protein
MAAGEAPLEIPAALLERLPGELCERLRTDWRAVLEERSAAALDWRWAANPTGDEDISPLKPQREGYRPGKRRKLPAPDGRELMLYGYDAGGHAVVAIERDGIGKDDRYVFLWHEDKESLVVLLQAPRRMWPAKLLAAWRSRNVGGRPVTIEYLGAEGRLVEECRWGGDRVVEVRHASQTREWNVGYRDVIKWDGSKLLRIERHWQDGAVGVTFEPPVSRPALDSLLHELENELVDRIARAAAEVGGQGPVCALALGYCDGEMSLPPQLVACPDAVRRQLLQENDDAFWYRWQAAEWMSAAEVPEITSYGDSDFNLRCERVDRQIRLKGDEQVIARLLQAVARRLNDVDWRDRLHVTQDFWVYPWEIHGESLEDDLAATGVPREA